MKRLTRIPLLSVLALSTMAATAMAQPAASADPAPDEERNVSTMKGQLVKVGDRNRYDYEYKKFNVSTNPIGLMVGSYGVSLQYAASEHVALRGDLNFYAPPDSDVRGFEVGVGAPIYFRKMYSGVFIEPGMIVRQMDYEMSSESNTQFGPQMLVGYHWYWDSGFNVAIAGGIGRNFNSSDDDEYGDADILPAGYLRFGYAF